VPSTHLFFSSIAFSSCVCFFQLFGRNVSLEVLGLEAGEDTPLDMVDLLSETLLDFMVDMVDLGD
jgi:hypothetical protein